VWSARPTIDCDPYGALIFGNPAVGAPLMLRNQTIGIDLPMKALAWEDERGQVWLTYNAQADLPASAVVPEGFAVR
jgi:uncharacterized protein (DUF302 family)